jgi:hypothetical protein
MNISFNDKIWNDLYPFARWTSVVSVKREMLFRMRTFSAQQTARAYQGYFDSNFSTNYNDDQAMLSPAHDPAQTAP